MDQMSAIDVVKDPNIEKVKKRKEKGIVPLSSKKKSYFSKIRSAIKKTKK
jgi:hypothetical protein